MSGYEEWVKYEASVIKSDGCSKVTDIHKFCCLEHDLAYYYGRNPKHAFVVGWDKAQKVTRGDADTAFRRCNQYFSEFKLYSPMALWRWVGVRVGGWNAWNKHRKVRS